MTDFQGPKGILIIKVLLYVERNMFGIVELTHFNTEKQSDYPIPSIRQTQNELIYFRLRLYKK